MGITNINNKFTIRICYYLLLFVVSMLLIGQTPTPTPIPISTPDSISIIETHGYQGLLETGLTASDRDYLILVHYEIVYGTIPTEPARDTYIIRLKLAGNEIGSFSPFVFVDNGYGKGIASFYYTASEAVSLGLSPTVTPNITLQGNPAVFGTPPTLTSNLNHWHSSTDSYKEFQDEIVNLSFILQNEWGITLIELRQSGGQHIFTQDGDSYIHQTVLRIKDIIPRFFIGTTIPIDVAQESFGKAGETTALTRLDGTGIPEALTDLSAYVGLSRDNFATIITLLASLIIGGIAFGISQRPETFFIAIVVIFPIAAYWGIPTYTHAGVIVFLALLIGVGVSWALRRA